jgi:hypothetical protein
LFIAGLLFGALVVSGVQVASAETPLPLVFSGEVTSLERSADAVVVKGGEPLRKKKFFLTRGGQVTRAGQVVSLADLKRGDRVEVTYTAERSYLFARSIAIAAGGAAGAASASE